MPLSTRIETHGFELSPVDERRIEHHLHALEVRLEKRPEPSAILILTQHRATRAIEANLRIQLGPLGSHLLARERAGTAAHATRLAVEHIERQLERRAATQRGEPTYGVPSRRRPTPPLPRRSKETSAGDAMDEGSEE